MQETKWSYKIIQDILAEPNVVAVKWPARLDREYRTFFRKESLPDLYSNSVKQIIDASAKTYSEYDKLYIIRSDGSEELFRTIKWVE